MNCRNCKQCKDDEKTEVISIKKEIDVIHNPSHKLAPSKNKALAIYNQQVKKLEKNLKDKQDVIASEGKLHALGHVCYSKDLSSELQKMLQEHPVQNYIPLENCVERKFTKYSL